MVPGSAPMQEEGTQYTQRPWATRSAAARMLSTVPSYTVGVNPAARHISMVNWLNSGARASSASSSGSLAKGATGMASREANRWPGGTPAGRPRRDGKRFDPGGGSLFGEQQRLFSQGGDGYGVQGGEPVAGGDQDPQRIVTEQVRGDLRRGQP